MQASLTSQAIAALPGAIQATNEKLGTQRTQKTSVYQNTNLQRTEKGDVIRSVFENSKSITKTKGVQGIVEGDI